MTAPGTRAQAQRERLDASRALLARPVLTAPDDLALVRLHAPELRAGFKSLLGYDLVVESTFARLVKAPLAPTAPSRPARRHDGKEFVPATYTHLALLCAALLSPSTGEQILISALIDQVRSDAATIGLDLHDTLPERRAMVNALGQLIAWGVLTETDGTTSGWGERREEVLLTIHRPLLPHLLARPLSDLAHPDDLLRGAEEPSERSLRRKLVENPLVRREDLTDDEREVLRRERRELERQLAEYFGLTLEVRSEGALAYDTDPLVTDIVFPGTGTRRQAALLLLGVVGDLLEPEAGTEVAATWEQVDEALAELVAEHGRAWGDVDREAVVALLHELSLVTPAEDRLIIHPAVARYRPRPQAAPPTRAARRREAADDPGVPLF